MERRWRWSGADRRRQGSWSCASQPMQPREPRMAMPSTDPPGQDAAVAALLRRVAAAAGVHMYEMEMLGELDYVCHVWIGQALESLLGGVPEGMDQELACESCIHPDDRPAYEA